MHITNTSVANNYRLVHDASCINSKSQTRPGPRCIAECLFQGVAYRNVRRGEREWHRKGHAKCARANVKQSRRAELVYADHDVESKHGYREHERGERDVHGEYQARHGGLRGDARKWVIPRDFRGHVLCSASRRTARAPFDMSILRTGLVLALLALCAAAEPQRVLLRDVPSLAFESGRMTAGRRTAPVPQMAQTGGPRAPLRGIFCRNAGWDGADVHWECAPADGAARLGSFAITCEGYDFAGDPYHLAGSCGIEYTLLPSADEGGAVLAVLGAVVLFGVALTAVACLCIHLSSAHAAPPKDACRIYASDPADAPVYDALPRTHRRDRGAAPVVHVHAPAPDPFRDMAMLSMANACAAPRAPVVVHQAAPAVPAPTYGKSSTSRPAPVDAPAAPAAATPSSAYGKSSTSRPASVSSWFGASSSGGSSLGKSRTR